MNRGGIVGDVAKSAGRAQSAHPPVAVDPGEARRSAAGSCGWWRGRARGSDTVLLGRPWWGGGAAASIAPADRSHYQLPTTSCLRAMIDFAIKVARSKSYPHAARHLETCHRLAAAINDWGGLVDHRSYMLQLRRVHDRKRGFWSEVPKTIIPEAEVAAQPANKTVAKTVQEGRGLRSSGVADGEAGSVQPGLW